MSYSDYLQSSHWKEVRQKKVSSVKVCQICSSSKNLHVHHKNYKTKDMTFVKNVPVGMVERVVVGNELSRDLMVLCASCHRLWHIYIGLKRIRRKHLSKLKRLIKMGVTRQKAFWIFAKEPALYDIIYSKYNKNYA